MGQRFKLTIEYDGRPFVGWQRQDNGPSVQGTIESAIANFDGPRSDILVYGSGRTDAGVHALGQVAHVDIRRTMKAYAFQSALNFFLIDTGITIVAVEDVPPTFHARFDAVQRHYEYRILNRPAAPSFERGLVWHVKHELDETIMNEAAQIFIGHHDFTTFRHGKCQAKSPMKTLDYIKVTRSGNYIRVYMGARSFLHHQVRSIVGCLKLVGDGVWSKKQLQASLEARNRNALGLNAPPDGLYFSRIDFGKPSVRIPNSS